ncbi:nuclear transport factor 2 family protein [Flavivirga sp. 57AJ16]|uniref:YybH family protein n=1 Tax=Flavivirga sp. 57AJ16 TaxID=3025307 RepID=UPI002366338A|nr:nuclear transport factor 2 family protein [Flavivirga sp. 57AJ16]MDD7887402.1 nuclear transport factor 2 family protein [Flavivirga sp. 57AJ16]
MKLLATYIVSLFFLFSNSSIAQNINDLKDINAQIWTNFSKSFKTLDYKLFESLCSDDLIRVNKDIKSIKTKEAYLNGYKNRWENASLKQTISFRFLERFSKNGIASERGIYKFTRDLNTGNEKSYYGKFHVILKKEGNLWKILIDYDSTENESINETHYHDAFALDDFEKY